METIFFNEEFLQATPGKFHYGAFYLFLTDYQILKN